MVLKKKIQNGSKRLSEFSWHLVLRKCQSIIKLVKSLLKKKKFEKCMDISPSLLWKWFKFENKKLLKKGEDFENLRIWEEMKRLTYVQKVKGEGKERSNRVRYQYLTSRSQYHIPILWIHKPTNNKPEKNTKPKINQCLRWNHVLKKRVE